MHTSPFGRDCTYPPTIGEGKRAPPQVASFVIRVPKQTLDVGAWAGPGQYEADKSYLSKQGVRMYKPAARKVPAGHTVLEPGPSANRPWTP